eukprot:6296154-Amphidinium_carterae.1
MHEFKEEDFIGKEIIQQFCINQRLPFKGASHHLWVPKSTTQQPQIANRPSSAPNQATSANRPAAAPRQPVPPPTVVAPPTGPPTVLSPQVQPQPQKPPQ